MSSFSFLQFYHDNSVIIKRSEDLNLGMCYPSLHIISWENQMDVSHGHISYSSEIHRMFFFSLSVAEEDKNDVLYVSSFGYQYFILVNAPPSPPKYPVSLAYLKSISCCTRFSGHWRQRSGVGLPLNTQKKITHE